MASAVMTLIRRVLTSETHAGENYVLLCHTWEGVTGCLRLTGIIVSPPRGIHMGGDQCATNADTFSLRCSDHTLKSDSHSYSNTLGTLSLTCIQQNGKHTSEQVY